MNEFTSKKLGEVLAFAEVEIETFEKGHTALISALGDEMVEKMISESKNHKATILKIARENSVEEVVLKKLEGTFKKLRQMRDLYVGDQWDNPTELLEWSGFFEGAFLVHLSLIKGAGESTKHTEITLLAMNAIELHEEMFKKVNYLLHEVGKKKSI